MNSGMNSPAVLRCRWWRRSSLQRFSFQRRGLQRRGVTVIEVMFSMGIALMGLAGIASLLLLAGRQASDSNRTSEAQAAAQHWYSEFTSRGMNNSSQWAWWNDATSTLTWFNKNLAATVPGKGSTTLFLRQLGRESVCLDPLFLAGRDMTVANLNGSNWYRPAVFPYYADRYNPTIDPAYFNAGLQWQDQPRMLRVTWAQPSLVAPFYPPVARNSKFLEQLFMSQDDLTVIGEETDLSLPPARGISFYTAPGTGLPLGRYTSQSEYSWLATLCPSEPRNLATEVTDEYTLSLVVVKNRDRIYYDPAASTPRIAGDPAQPENNPQGERLTWVVPQSGDFNGGNGGRVRLIGSDGVDSKVQVGDWIMLSKYFALEGFATPPPNIRPNAIFRWYRVVAVDSDEVLTDLPSLTAAMLIPEPYGLTPPGGALVWFQDVVLDGPDWSFSPNFTVAAGGGSVTVPTPTTGTLIKGAVSVYERVINVQ